MNGFLNFFVYALAFSGAISSSVLMYDGLLSREERRRRKLMTKRRLKAFQIQVREVAVSREIDTILERAGRPLGLTAYRYQLIRHGIIISLAMYYLALPLVVEQRFVFLVIPISIFLLVVSSPKLPFSAFSFFMRKLEKLHDSRKNNEIFQLYDSLISEFQLMESRQANTYHVLKKLYKNFDNIQPELQELLEPSNWTDDPTSALERFADRINTSEAHMLVNILSKFDQHTDKDVAISSLESNSELFATNQIENLRMRRKLINDMALIPIFATHMLIMSVFLGVIIVLSMYAFNQSNM